jgi:uncharacterized protein (TIRG00374 family)
VTTSGAAGRWVHVTLALVTIGLLALFARGVDWHRAWDAATNASPGILAIAVVANLASLAVKGVRWSLFLEAAGVTGMAAVIRATFAGAALNNVLVANGGDAARVAALARQSATSSAAVLATLVVDRACDLISYTVLFVVAAFALPVPPSVAKWRVAGAIALVAVLCVVALIGWRSSRPSTESTKPPDEPISRVRRYWRQLAATTGAVSTPSRLAAAIGLSFIAWAGQWATFHYAARSADFGSTGTTSLLALLLVNASFLIRLTPGNVGVFQLLYTLATTAAGLDRADAVAVAFLIQVIQYIPVTVIGLLIAPSLVRGPTTISPDRMRVRGNSELGP